MEKLNSKSSLLAASAAALKLCTPNYDRFMSYEYLHTLNKRATPMKIMQYKTSILLHKTYNSDSNFKEFIDLFFNQNFNARAKMANFITTSKFKVGKNIITNRFSMLNNKISYDWLNLQINPFKLKVKELFLK